MILVDASVVIGVVLACVAIEYGIEFWTRDQHFSLMQAVLPKLKLFQEPP